ncbi:hypothetical protein DUNSADRAFT_11082 [Dunaliella salina]|uniref:Uncharacterized protein n=1 Tax=Dunaliella salina TaxID=3046 RepID=A0ABQ7GE19_DUNSA|nr:hypothetical protein DUNSADRAFT_11082 [Dunaliella salina]|eukprot:KAF5832862.1 hypothetical protein DUNSADRAFT_11082 [Dunaliella salina]
MQPTFDPALENELRQRRKKPLSYKTSPFRDNDAIIASSSHELTQDPANLKALLHRGQAYARKELWQPALADYNYLLELNPENTDAWYYRGALFEKLMRLDDAIHDFSKVLSLDANHVMASYARASCRNRQGDLFQAIEDYTYALERDATAHNLHAAVNSSKRRSLDPKRRSAVDVSPQTNTWQSGRGQIGSQSLDLGGSQACLGAGSVAQAASLSARAAQGRNLDEYQLGTARGGGERHSDTSALQPRILLGDLSHGRAAPVATSTPQTPSVSYFTLPDALLQTSPPLHQRIPAPSQPEEHANTAPLPSNLEPHPRARTFEGREEEGHPPKNRDRRNSWGAAQERISGRCDSPDAHQQWQLGDQHGDDHKHTHGLGPGVQGLSGADGGQQLKLEDGSGGRRQELDAHHAGGLAFRKANDYRSAVHEYALALQVDPRHFKSLFNKGFSHDKVRHDGFVSLFLAREGWHGGGIVGLDLVRQRWHLAGLVPNAEIKRGKGLSQKVRRAFAGGVRCLSF